MGIEVYTREGCLHCNRTKFALRDGEYPFIEHKIGVDVDRETVVSMFPEQKMLPIIVVNGQVVGSFEALQNLIDSGVLRALIGMEGQK